MAGPNVFSFFEWLVWGCIVFLSGTVAGLVLSILAGRVQRHRRERRSRE